MVKKYWKLHSKERKAYYIRNHKRLRRDKNRRAINKKIKIKALIKKMKLEINSRISSRILGLAKVSKIKRTRKEIKLIAPQQFSLSMNFDKTMEFISYYANLCIKIDEFEDLNNIILDFSRTSIFDLDASGILDYIYRASKPAFTSRRIATTGKWPKNTSKEKGRLGKAMINFMTLGFVNDPMFKFTEGPLKGQRLIKVKKKLCEKEGILLMDFKKCTVKNKDLVLTDFTRFLRSSKIALSEKVLATLISGLGEVMDNVSQHSKNDLDWYFVGNYIPDEAQNKAVLNITIMNFGNSIAQNMETFLGTPTPKIQSQPELLRRHDKIEKILDYHSRSKLTREQLLTFIAFQSGMSSVIEEKEKPDRGNGLKKFITDIKNIKGEDNTRKFDISVISGETTIKFLNKYDIIKRGNEYGNTIPFNHTNTIFDKQDSKCFDRHYGLEGTVVNITRNIFLEENL